MRLLFIDGFFQSSQEARVYVNSTSYVTAYSFLASTLDVGRLLAIYRSWTLGVGRFLFSREAFSSLA
jgi:hypothetical protein